MVLGYAINNKLQLLLFTHNTAINPLAFFSHYCQYYSQYKTSSKREPEENMLDGAAVNNKSLDLYPPKL
jgi:hypothetical protein